MNLYRYMITPPLPTKATNSEKSYEMSNWNKYAEVDFYGGTIKLPEAEITLKDLYALVDRITLEEIQYKKFGQVVRGASARRERDEG